MGMHYAGLNMGLSELCKVSWLNCARCHEWTTNELWKMSPDT